MNKIKKFLHDKLDWGFPALKVSGDPFQPTYACRFCSDRLAQDSQGNWFHLNIEDCAITLSSETLPMILKGFTEMIPKKGYIGELADIVPWNPKRQ